MFVFMTVNGESRLSASFIRGVHRFQRSHAITVSPDFDKQLCAHPSRYQGVIASLRQRGKLPATIDKTAIVITNNTLEVLVNGKYTVTFTFGRQDLHRIGNCKQRVATK